MSDSFRVSFVLAICACVFAVILTILIAVLIMLIRERSMRIKMVEVARKTDVIIQKTSPNDVTNDLEPFKKQLLQSAFDLQSRLGNQVNANFLYEFYQRSSRDREYAAYSTAYFFAEFLGWLEIVRQRVVFVTGSEYAEQLNCLIEAIKFQFTGETPIQGCAPKSMDMSNGSTDFYDCEASAMQLYIVDIRSIGNAMLIRKEISDDDKDPSTDPEFLKPISCDEFIRRVASVHFPSIPADNSSSSAALRTRPSYAVEPGAPGGPHEESPENLLFQRTMMPLTDAINHLASLPAKRSPKKRMAMLQVLLCKLIDILDSSVPWDLGPKFDADEEPRYIQRDIRLTPGVKHLSPLQIQNLSQANFFAATDPNLTFPGFREDLAHKSQHERDDALWLGACPPREPRKRDARWLQVFRYSQGTAPGLGSSGVRRRRGQRAVDAGAPMPTDATAVPGARVTSLAPTPGAAPPPPPPGGSTAADAAAAAKPEPVNPMRMLAQQLAARQAAMQAEASTASLAIQDDTKAVQDNPSVGQFADGARPSGTRRDMLVRDTSVQDRNSPGNGAAGGMAKALRPSRSVKLVLPSDYAGNNSAMPTPLPPGAVPSGTLGGADSAVDAAVAFRSGGGAAAVERPTPVLTTPARLGGGPPAGRRASVDRPRDILMESSIAQAITAEMVRDEALEEAVASAAPESPPPPPPGSLLHIERSEDLTDGLIQSHFPHLYRFVKKHASIHEHAPEATSPSAALSQQHQASGSAEQQLAAPYAPATPERGSAFPNTSIHSSPPPQLLAGLSLSHDGQQYGVQQYSGQQYNNPEYDGAQYSGRQFGSVVDTHPVGAQLGSHDGSRQYSHSQRDSITQHGGSGQQYISQQTPQSSTSASQQYIGQHTAGYAAPDRATDDASVAGPPGNMPRSSADGRTDGRVALPNGAPRISSGNGHMHTPTAVIGSLSCPPGGDIQTDVRQLSSAQTITPGSSFRGGPHLDPPPAQQEFERPGQREVEGSGRGGEGDLALWPAPSDADLTDLQSPAGGGGGGDGGVGGSVTTHPRADLDSAEDKGYHEFPTTLAAMDSETSIGRRPRIDYVT